MYAARQNKEKINRTIHKLKTNKKNTELSNISRNSYAIQCEKWEKLYENYYIWDKLRNGIRWYGYYENNVFNFYYIIEDKSKIPEDKKENYESNEKKLFSQSETDINWLKEEIVESDVIDNINEKPGLGLELELNDPNLQITTKEAKEEYAIKGHSMKNIANGCVDVTFDTRTGYNSQIANQKLVIELVFDGSKILIKKEEDYSRLKQDLINDLKELKFDDLRKSEIGSFVSIERDSTKSEFIFDDFTKLTFNLHITLALSLDLIGNLMKQGGNEIFHYGIETDKYVCLLNDYENVMKNFDYNKYQQLTAESKKLEHINSDALAFCEMFYKAFKPHASNDPKQNMDVMNRTSFGKMFSLLKLKSKEQVLRFIENEMDKEAVYSSEHHKITVNDMLSYFKSLNINEISPSMDPTYHANRDFKAEKMGISQLGNKTEKDLLGEVCPIVEIRSVSDKIKLKRLEELDQMIVKIVEKLWPNSTDLKSV